ncbi:MAG: hypothetical protein JWO06_2667 [Bacteroidota bacterium]|nr:hypothetical protein [Bacteroidota bacterium]
MSRIIYIGFVLLISISESFCQQGDLGRKVSELGRINSMPGTSALGDSLYWNIVKERLAIVPYLINRIDDSSRTNAHVELFGGDFTLGDICYSALQDIIPEIPTLQLIRKSGCTDPDNGYWNYWLFLRKDAQNRRKFKKEVANWFAINRDKLIWVNSKYNPNQDNKFPNPAGGYYKLKK